MRDLTGHKISDRARERAWLQGGRSNNISHRSGVRFAFCIAWLDLNEQLEGVLLKSVVREMLYNDVTELAGAEELTSAKEAVSLRTNVLPKNSSDRMIAAEPAQTLATLPTAVLDFLIGMARTVAHVPPSMRVFEALHVVDAQMTSVRVRAHGEEAVFLL